MTPTLHLIAVRLHVSDLARSLDFYARRLGFFVARESATEAELGSSSDAAPILTLVGRKSARPAPREAAGLFHAALLFPNRGGLGTWLQFTAEKGVDFEGFSDHAVSEAIYLSDPDGNGLEFYTDRPRESWPFANGELAMVTRPLAVRSLLAEATTAGGTPLAGSRWGHLHLRVTDLDRSEAFYREKLGLDVMQRSFPGARFLAADGYHHHLGLNTWGSPRLPQPAQGLGLAEATFARMGVETEASLVDPDGIHVRVQPALVAA
ncbi:MAG: VOC family protein [Opitutaceae bacterium]